MHCWTAVKNVIKQVLLSFSQRLWFRIPVANCFACINVNWAQSVDWALRWVIGLCNVSGWYHNKKIIFAEGSLTPLITSPNICMKIMWVLDPRERSTFAGGKDARGSFISRHVTSWIIIVELTPVKNLFAAVFARRRLQEQKMRKSTRGLIQVRKKVLQKRLVT